MEGDLIIDRDASNLASAPVGSLKKRDSSAAAAGPLAAANIVTTLKSAPILLVARTAGESAGKPLSSNVSFPNSPNRATALKTGFWMNMDASSPQSNLG